ncbi:ion channel [Guyparkeria halophila]|uniref:Ion channel n=1 Tax=Guyparkeria halophila TaxID=47960 RepID=A0ABZ0Z073_9GAMM|nr:ion channel [Guyparkeria halophila]WQH16984.1 ion channel [Guyparkeria halophila]
MADRPFVESPEKHTARLLISWGVRFTRLLGIGGVADHENRAAQRWAVRLELPLLLISLWIPVQWYLEHTGQVEAGQGFWVDQLIWGFFLVEQLMLLALVKDKLFYLKTNWLLVAVVAIGLPLILIEAVAFMLGLRLLRVLLVLITALRLGRRYFRELGRHVFFAIGLMTAFLLVLAGSLMPVLDPQTFDDFSDGAWWALVTLSTVGYGDLVPQTAAARAMGFVFVGVAVVWLALISASTAAFLVGLRMEASSQDEERIDMQILRRLDRIESLLEQERAARQEQGDRGADSGTGHEPPGR